MNSPKEIDDLWGRVDVWERQERERQEDRIGKLRQGFLHLALFREDTEDKTIDIPHTVLAANLAYGPNLSAPAIEDFALEAYRANFLTAEDELGMPMFRTKLFVGLMTAVQNGKVLGSSQYAEYTHAKFSPTADLLPLNEILG